MGVTVFDDEEVALQRRDDASIPTADDSLFRRSLTDDELDQIMLMAESSKCLGDIVVGFFRGFILPAIGQDWDLDYPSERSLPVQRIKIPKDQWHAICGVLIKKFAVQGGLVWMNVGPGSYQVSGPPVV